MRLLLDTHILSWWWTDNPRLRPALRQMIASPDSSVYISAISAWEMSAKHHAGWWPDAGLMLGLWGELMLRDGFQPLSITAAHGQRAGALDWAHRDPFDRIFAAQSMEVELSLVSADPALLNFVESLVWAG